jgi:WD40 repeat protein
MRSAAFLVAVCACACSSAEPPRNHAIKQEDRRTSTPPAPLANGALYSAALVPVLDVNRRGDSARTVAIWNDGTVVVVAGPDESDSEVQRLFVVSDFGRASAIALSTDAGQIVLDGDGHHAAVVTSYDHAVETLDVESGKRTKLAPAATRPDWLRRFANPLAGLSPSLVGTSRNGAWAVWGYVGALVPHTYIVSAAGLVDLEMTPPDRVAVGDDGVAMFFTHEHNDDRTSTYFFAKTYALRASQRQETLDEVSKIVAARLDAGAYAAAPLSSGFAVGYDDGHIGLMDRAMSTESQTFKTDSPVVALAASPDQKQLASIHADGRLYVWPL